MKTLLKSFLAAGTLAMALSGCSNEEFVTADGQGTIFLSTSLNSDVKVQSRADVADYADQTIIWIANEKGLLYDFRSLNDVPAEGIKLLSGSYNAMAWVGDSVPASFDAKFFRGSQDFAIENGDRKSVEVNCKIANVVVAVNFDATLDDVLKDYSVTVGHSQGELEFTTANTDSRGYFMMNSRDHDLTWTLAGTLADGSAYERTGKIEAAKAATLYTINIACSTYDEEIGGAYIMVEVDDSEAVVDKPVVIVAAPKISGFNFDLNATVRGEQHTIQRHSLWITAATEITSLNLDCACFKTMYGLKGQSFDFLLMENETLKQTIIDSGINFVSTYDEVSKNSTIKLNFEKKFFDTLENGEYPIKITVTDDNGKSANATLKVIVSDATISTVVFNPTDIWATSATLSMEILKEGVTNPGISYRKQGVSSWTTVPATLGRGDVLTAKLTDLTPGTTYEYCASSDDSQGEVLTFTTEAAAQIPNCGFEDWSLEKDKLWMPYTSASAKYWDSGNTALTTYSNFISEGATSRDNSIKHSGEYALKLKSMSVMGVQFAAGNVFIGEFIRTDGTNGVLGWGRAWQSRPTAMKVWVKYEPKNISSDNSDYTALKKGDLDKGIIYIALLDDSKMLTDSGKSYPVIVKTKAADRTLFDKNGSNVIAYGEHVFEGNVGPDGMVQIEIPLDYNRLDVKPSYIMCTASASMGGDYFVGGEGSTLYIDDIELVY